MTVPSEVAVLRGRFGSSVRRFTSYPSVILPHRLFRAAIGGAEALAASQGCCCVALIKHIPHEVVHLGQLKIHVAVGVRVRRSVVQHLTSDFLVVRAWTLQMGRTWSNLIDAEKNCFMLLRFAIGLV